MIEVYKNTIIYVACPAFYKTGGTELLHQLVKALNECGNNAVIAYYWTKNDDKNKNINPAFKEYVDGYIQLNKINDESANILILPETRIKFFDKFKKIRIAVWWMSVDNYKKDSFDCFLECKKKYGFISAMKRLLENNLNTDKYIAKIEYNLCQSYYAMDFIRAYGAKNILFLSDYINDKYIRTLDFNNRQDYVLYNPKKGYEFTEKIIKIASDLTFKPIENLSTDEVAELLTKSKVYIDFGNHPGKDRFPREAAASGCCVITGKRGSAAFIEDVPVPYKFEENEDIQLIISTIRKCINDYRLEVEKYKEYREMIYREKMDFKKQVRDIFDSPI